MYMYQYLSLKRLNSVFPIYIDDAFGEGQKHVKGPGYWQHINIRNRISKQVKRRGRKACCKARTWKEGVKVAGTQRFRLIRFAHTPSGACAGIRVFFRREKSPRSFRSSGSGARISANESENPPAARVATIFMGLLVRASDSRSREFASLGAQGLNKS